MKHPEYTIEEIIEAIEESAQAEKDPNDVHDYVLHGAALALLVKYRKLLKSQKYWKGYATYLDDCQEAQELYEEHDEIERPEGE